MSNRKFLVPIEFPDGTVQSTAYTGSNSAVNVGSSAPLSPSNGDLFYNTTTDEFYLYIMVLVLDAFDSLDVKRSIRTF